MVSVCTGFHYSPELDRGASDDEGVGLEDVTGGGFVDVVGGGFVDVLKFDDCDGDGVGVGDGSEVVGLEEVTGALELGFVSGVDDGSDDRADTELEFVSRFTIRTIEVA